MAIRKTLDFFLLFGNYLMEMALGRNMVKVNTILLLGSGWDGNSSGYLFQGDYAHGIIRPRDTLSGDSTRGYLGRDT